MDGLFSHASGSSPHEGTHPAAPENWSVAVPVGMVQAAEGFLEYLHLWWPTSVYSVGGAGGQLWWDRDRLVEGTESGESITWGITEVWDPPLTVSCEISLPGAAGDRWVLTVEPGPSSSMVHFRAPRPRWSPSGNETVGEAAALSDDFWGTILGFYARFMGATTSPRSS